MDAITTMRKLQLQNGEEINLTLNFYTIYQLKEKKSDIYERYNTIRMNGIKEELDQATVVYAAYLCANIEKIDECMDEMEFLRQLPENHMILSSLVMELLNGKKK